MYLVFICTKKYNIFLLLCLFCRYVAVYFSILYFRYRAGIVTKEMLSVPKLPFLIVGVLESLALAAGMAAACMFMLMLLLKLLSLPIFYCNFSRCIILFVDVITYKHYTNA